MNTIANRPTERAAVKCRGPVLPPAERVIDLLIVARATDDRYGARHFSHLLDRVLGVTK